MQKHRINMNLLVRNQQKQKHENSYISLCYISRSKNLSASWPSQKSSGHARHPEQQPILRTPLRACGRRSAGGEGSEHPVSAAGSRKAWRGGRGGANRHIITGPAFNIQLKQSDYRPTQSPIIILSVVHTQQPQITVIRVRLALAAPKCQRGAR